MSIIAKARKGENAKRRRPPAGQPGPFRRVGNGVGGARVVVAGSREHTEELQAIQRELGTASERVSFERTDVFNEEEVERLVDGGALVGELVDLVLARAVGGDPARG